MAIEEVKTFLDDIYEAREESHIKNEKQITLVINYAEKIQNMLSTDKISTAINLVRKLLIDLSLIESKNAVNAESSIALSRGDYKVCFSIFEKEALQAGFAVDSFEAFGKNPEQVGCLGVYVLKK